MRIYNPHPVSIPPNINIHREFPESLKLCRTSETDVNVDAHDVMPSPYHYNRLLRNVDRRTVFFDVFFDKNKDQLIGIGPRLFNLAKEILPLEVYIDCKRIQHEICEKGNCLLFRSAALSSFQIKPTRIELKFNQFTHSFNVSANEFSNFAQIDKRRVTISTLQKNNDVQWIIDWILWHRRLHGIERVILYDNGSENRSELIEQLNKLSTIVDTTMVDWQFPFGIHPFMSTKEGFLNHCRLRFPVKDGYCINLDVDEYLVNMGQIQLDQYLDHSLNSPYLGAVQLKECKLPNIRIKTNSAPRIFDFQYRFKKFGHYPTKKHTRPYTKYIYEFNAPIYLEVHSIKFSSFECLLSGVGILKRFKIWCMRLKCMYRRQRMKWVNPAIDKNELPTFFSLRIRETNFFFFHAQGLSTNWKNIPIKGLVEFDDKLHVLEPLIQELCSLASLHPQE